MQRNLKESILKVLTAQPGVTFSTVELREMRAIHTGTTQAQMIDVLEDMPGIIIRKNGNISLTWCYCPQRALAQEVENKNDLKLIIWLLVFNLTLSIFILI